MNKFFITLLTALLLQASQVLMAAPASPEDTTTADAPVRARVVALTAETRDQAVYINWKAENEMNVNRYEVQRFNDQEGTFATVGIAFAANSETPMEYRIKLPLGTGDTTRYRLVWQENDGLLGSKETL
ncbi:hypothetical protein V9K67_07680 [Paraflavisolibacter sp. H34]|uniref:hypothetical protein n=1 Tax=Huijunlia imazamoxiresistens TaxID=3127457 RepID=UPI003018A167